MITIPTHGSPLPHGCPLRLHHYNGRQGHQGRREMGKLALSLRQCYRAMHHPPLEETESEILKVLETVLG